MSHIKRYNQEITLFLFCIGMFCYALGLSSFGKSFSIQSFFYIGGLLFILCNYHSFKPDIWRILFIPLICFGVVFILGILTLFDDVWHREVSVVLKAINQHIVGYFVLFLIMFLYAMFGKTKYVFYFLVFFALLCAFEVFSTLYLGLKNGFFKGANNVPYFFQAIYTYNIWLLAPAAMSIAGIFAFQKKYLKLLSLCGVLLTFIAMLVNGERSFLVAFAGMIFVPFIVLRYRYKMFIFLVVLCLGATMLLSFYHVSKKLPPRYNVAHILDNFLIVWNTSPIEMGQYDELCFGNQTGLTCAPESLALGKNDIILEHSALSRINMSKSTLLAALDSPFSPHIVGVFQIGEYLWKYYNLKNHHHRSYIIEIEGRSDLNGYNNPHNFVVSLLFSYGILGLCAVIVFQFFLFFNGVKNMRKGGEKELFFCLSLCIFVCGVSVQCFFDVIYPTILKCIFIWLGCLFGLGYCNEDFFDNR